MLAKQIVNLTLAWSLMGWVVGESVVYFGNYTPGKTPRGFGIDPTGPCLIAANRNAHAVYAFKIHPLTGVLEWTGSRIGLPYPVCVAFPVR